MEIKFINTLFENNKNEINCIFNENEIVGVINTNLYSLLEGKILSGKIKYKKYVFDKNLPIKKHSEIYYFCRNNIDELYSLNMMDYITSMIHNVDGNRLYELFKIFGLKKQLLELPYIKISTSERKKIILIGALMTEKNIIVLENPTSYLDDKSKETLIKELKRLKRNKIIIVNTDDTEFLLKVAEKVILNVDNKIVIGSKYDILSDEKLLNKAHLMQSELLMFINKVRKSKSIKIPYRDNINDTIKDVYRHV